jgi:hypothetical protein
MKVILRPESIIINYEIVEAHVTKKNASAPQMRNLKLTEDTVGGSNRD